MSKITTIAAGKPLSIRHLLMELWHYRGLIWAFSARDLKVKYFQTIFGPLWVVMTPLITVGVMTFVFGLMIKVPSDGTSAVVELGVMSGMSRPSLLSKLQQKRGGSDSVNTHWH